MGYRFGSRTTRLDSAASTCPVYSGSVKRFASQFLFLLDHYVEPRDIREFIHSRIYKAPLQEIYSEAPPAQPRRYRSVLSNLQNALSLFLGRIRISKGRPFQVEGPTMENARRCLVAVLYIMSSYANKKSLNASTYL